MENQHQEIVVGLDIGTTKIAALVGRRNEQGKIEIIGMGRADSVGVTRGVISHITPTVNAIQQAIEEAETKSGYKIKVVNVGIAGQHIRSVQSHGSRTRASLDNEITQEDIDVLIEDMQKLVMPPGEQIIEVLPQEYVVDGEHGISNPIGMSGIRLEANFHIIAGQITAARNIYKCVRKTGLDVSALTLEPLASADAVLTDEDKEAGVALVDIGGGTTDIAIFQDKVIRHTAVIPFGGNIITDDIKEGCTILRKHAELLKVRFGSALSNENQENEIVAIPGFRDRPPKEISVKNLAHIIQARMEEIIEQIYYEIKNSGLEKKLIAGIVVTGGGAQLKHITQLFEYVTGMDTRIGYPVEYLAKGADDVSSPMYATAVGLVIKGAEKLDKMKQKLPNDIYQNNGDEPGQQLKKDAPLADRSSKLDIFFKKIKEWFESEGEME